MTSETDLAALLCSRLCHDLLSPVGALSNGLELLADEKDPEMRKRCFELLEQSVPARGGLEDDHIRRRRALIGLNRGPRAAHVQLDVRLRHPSIGYGGADNSGEIGRFAERLDRYARHRVDLTHGAIHWRPAVGCAAGVKRHRSLSPAAELRPDRDQHGVFPPRINETGA